MSDLTNRLSKAVWEYLDTATLRSEPFSLSRIEEVIAGVMATDSKVPVNVVRHPEYLEQANRKRQADAERAALEQYWLYVYGQWPKKFIDHIDRDKTNNAMSNLREASRSENQHNRPAPRTSTSGIKGVRKRKERWLVQVCLKGKSYHCGCYSTEKEAVAAYEAAARRLHGEFACNGPAFSVEKVADAIRALKEGAKP